MTMALVRCWESSDPLYNSYHDEEWGNPVRDEQGLYERLCLEGFQSGLSWLTILRKREAFRQAFAGFDFNAVARFGDRDVARLLGDAGIVRHRGKIEAVINNAERAVELVAAEGSLAHYIWSFEPAQRHGGLDRAALMKLAVTEDSTALAKDLKRRGWRFVGPTTVYAFMQAMGLVNDHLDGCHIQGPAAEARRAFARPCRGRGGGARRSWPPLRRRSRWAAAPPPPTRLLTPTAPRWCSRAPTSRSTSPAAPTPSSGTRRRRAPPASASSTSTLACATRRSTASAPP
jgi:DNA-3-methyladenine glycosylase I